MCRYGFSGSIIARATLALEAMFRSLTRPRAVFTRILPSLKSNQTGVTCGDPSGITVARPAKAFFSVSKSVYFGGILNIRAPLRADLAYRDFRPRNRRRQ